MSSPTARGFGAQDGAQGELRGVAAGAVLDEAGMRRALTRIAHEIVERHPPPEPLVLMGMQTRGVPLAERLAVSIEAIDGRRIPAGAIDNSLYRDDLARRSTARILPSRIPGDIDGSVIVLVDDVLFTGRSIRAALDALIDYGRPAAIELAVLVDRGHRELPIRADYVGKNLPTRRGDDVRVRLSEVDGVDEASLHPAPLELSGELASELSGEGGR